MLCIDLLAVGLQLLHGAARLRAVSSCLLDVLSTSASDNAHCPWVMCIAAHRHAQ